MTQQTTIQQSTNLKLIFGAASVFLIAAVGLIFTIYAAVYGMRGMASYEKEKKEISQGTKEIRALRDREQTELSKYGWLDKSSGKIQIPIERAMELVIFESHKKK